MKIDDYLGEDEELLLETEEKRLLPGGTPLHPKSMYVTNTRIITTKGWIKEEILDLMFDNIANTELIKGVFTHTIKFHIREDAAKFPKCDSLVAIPRKDAEKIFRIVREKTRSNNRFVAGQ